MPRINEGMQDIVRTHQDVALLGTPSTCFQFATIPDRFAVDETLKPGYRWLHLKPVGSLEHELKRVDDYPLSIDLNDRD